jgi:hypothetical protein
MRISPKFALAALLALDIFGNHAHVTEWTLRTGINGAADIGHTVATTVRDKVNSWTSDSPRHVVHIHHRPNS